MKSDSMKVAEQAHKLLTTGACDLPIVWDDIAHRLAHNPDFPLGLCSFMAGESRALRLMTEATIVSLCREQS